MLAILSLRSGTHPRLVKHRALMKSCRKPGLEIGYVLSAKRQAEPAVTWVNPVTTEHLFSRWLPCAFSLRSATAALAAAGGWQEVGAAELALHAAHWVQLRDARSGRNPCPEYLVPARLLPD